MSNESIPGIPVFSVGDRVFVHGNLSDGNPYWPGQVTETDIYGVGGTYAVAMDAGGTLTPDAAAMHHDPLPDDEVKWCRHCRLRLQQTESPQWPGPNAAR